MINLTTALRPLRALQNTPIVYAPMPKTASNTVLARLETSIQTLTIKPKTSGGIGHFLIDEQHMARAYKSILSRKIPLVYQHFLPLSHNHKVLCRNLNIKENPKILVSVRNIYDVAVSCAEHQDKSYGPWWISREDNQFLDPELMADHSHLWNAVICLKFYVAWASAVKSGKWDVYFVDYNEIVKKPKKTLESILNFFELEQTKSTNFEMIADNLNKGVSGRGENLDPYYKKVLLRFAGSFKNIDFSLIGL